MLNLPELTKIYIANEAVDMRKAIDGLCYQVIDQLAADPQSGHLFLFYNRQCNKVKALLWDKNGFVLIYKRLEKGRFKFSKQNDGRSYVIEHQQLKWLLAGFDFMQLKHHPDLYFSNYA